MKMDDKRMERRSRPSPMQEEIMRDLNKARNKRKSRPISKEKLRDKIACYMVNFLATLSSLCIVFIISIVFFRGIDLLELLVYITAIEGFLTIPVMYIVEYIKSRIKNRN